jgi:glycosyltransferase involved in cell wall biosynthesis
MLILPYIRRSLRKIRPDVLLSYGEWFNPFVIFSTRFLGVPLYICDRMGPEMKLDLVVGTAKKTLYKFATGIIVQTNTASRLVAEKTAAKKIAVIPNPVNTINTNTSVKKKQIVTLGRLSHEKGHIVLIRAFASLTQKEWTLHLIGEGPERPHLEREILKLGLSDRILLYGLLKDFEPILGESEIFVLPSFYEGFPNALIEAMSVPLACISSNCVAGPGDIIEDGVNGLLVDPGNVEALTSALNCLIENPGLRKRLASEAYKVRDTLAFDKIAQLYLDYIFPESE